MEAVFSRSDGRRILVYDEGNQILVSLLGAGRTAQYGVLCRDYHAFGVPCKREDNVYVAYVNLENKLCFDRLLSDFHITLAVGETLGEISDLAVAEIGGERTDLFVAYRKVNTKRGTNEIFLVNPFGERKSQLLVSEKERIETYRIAAHSGKSFLIYKTVSQANSKIFSLAQNHLGDISLSEYILCKEQTLEELSKTCKENDKEFQRALREKEEEYERRLKETAKDMEREYNRQYNELAKLTKGMQEEGRKWRELYYKSVTKN